MRKTALVIPLLALLATAALTACDPEPAGPSSPAPSTTTSGDPAPSDEPEPPVTAHHIRVGSTLIGIMDDTDTAYEAIHDGVTAADAVPLLTAAFGAEPVVTTAPGGIESGAATVYDWSGFRFIAPDDPTRFPPYSTWTVSVETAAVGGIPVYAGTEIQVGDSMSEAIAEEFGHAEYPEFYQAQLGRVAIDAASVGEAAGADLYVFLAVYGPSASGVVTGFTSQTPNWGV